MKLVVRDMVVLHNPKLAMAACMWFRNSGISKQWYANCSTYFDDWHHVPLHREHFGFYDRHERRWYWGRLSSQYHMNFHEDVITLFKGNRTFRMAAPLRFDPEGNRIHRAQGLSWHNDNNRIHACFATKCEAALFKLAYCEG